MIKRGHAGHSPELRGISTAAGAQSVESGAESGVLSMSNPVKLPFNESSKRALKLASEEAVRRNHEYVGSEHILCGLLQDHDGVAAQVLRSFGLTAHQARSKMSRLVKNGEHRVIVEDKPLTPRGRLIVENASDIASSLGHPWLGAEHLLLAIIDESTGLGRQILLNSKVPLQKLRNNVTLRLGAPSRPARPPPHNTQSPDSQ